MYQSGAANQFLQPEKARDGDAETSTEDTDFHNIEGGDSAQEIPSTSGKCGCTKAALLISGLFVMVLAVTCIVVRPRQNQYKDFNFDFTAATVPDQLLEYCDEDASCVTNDYNTICDCGCDLVTYIKPTEEVDWGDCGQRRDLGAVEDVDGQQVRVKCKSATTTSFENANEQTTFSATGSRSLMAPDLDDDQYDLSQGSFTDCKVIPSRGTYGGYTFCPSCATWDSFSDTTQFCSVPKWNGKIKLGSERSMYYMSTMTNGLSTIDYDVTHTASWTNYAWQRIITYKVYNYYQTDGDGSVVVTGNTGCSWNPYRLLATYYGSWINCAPASSVCPKVGNSWVCQSNMASGDTITMDIFTVNADVGTP